MSGSVAPTFSTPRGRPLSRTGSLLPPLLILVGAALLEVVGDAVIRLGLRGRGGWPVVLGGCLMLAGYGLVVNLLSWDFSRLLGTYVAVFALAGVLIGRLGFGEAVPRSTWLGLALIALGGLVIQAGRR